MSTGFALDLIFTGTLIRIYHARRARRRHRLIEFALQETDPDLFQAKAGDLYDELIEDGIWMPKLGPTPADGAEAWVEDHRSRIRLLQYAFRTNDFDRVTWNRNA